MNITTVPLVFSFINKLTEKYKMKSNKFTQFLRKNVTLLLVLVLVVTIGTTIFIGCTSNSSSSSTPESSTESVISPDNSSTENEDSSSSEESTEQEETPTTPEDSTQEEPTPQEPTETPNNPPVEEQPTPTPETPPVEEQEPVKVYFISPVEYTSLGLGYNDSGLVFNQYLKQWVLHKAIDLIAESGTPVKAMLDGVVLEVLQESSVGCMVKIDHGENVVITYGSLNSCSLTVGQTVKQGDIIGEVGTTYQDETGYGDHLHLEIVVDGVPVNPTPYIDGTVYREIEQE